MTPILKTLRNECDKSCKNKLKLINFDTNIETSGFDMNETILELTLTTSRTANRQ
jgi:hypothetical protein